MARFSQVLIPTNIADLKSTALANGAASGELVLNKRRAFVIVAYPNTAPTVPGGTGGIAIKFGLTGMTAPDATFYQIPLGQQTTFDTGDAYDRIRIFNNSSVAVDVYIKPLTSE
jgi:hypothetical protein